MLAYRGTRYARMGRYQEALADLNRAVELSPTDADIYGSRGRARAVIRGYITKRLLTFLTLSTWTLALPSL